MSQHDYVIDNQDGASFRADINDVLSAIVSNNSGASEPTTTFANMIWVDTTNNLVKQRNTTNTGWNTISTLGAKALHTADFVQSLAAAGYIKFPGGLIAQWGSQSVAATSTANVTLPIAFPTAFLQAIASSDAGSATSGRAGAAIVNTTTIQLINGAGTGAQTVRWLAIGY